MSEYFKANKMRPEQIQDFIPSPMTLATAMYYTEMNPHTGEKIYIEKAMSKRKLQKRTLQSFLPQNRFRKALLDRRKGKFPRTYIAAETDSLDSGNPLNINA